MPGPNPISGDIIKSRAAAFQAGQLGLNTIYWEVSGVSGSGATLLEIAEALSGVWHTHYKSLMGTTATFLGVGVSNITPPATIEYAYTGDDGAGTATGEPLPTQTAGLISLKTPFAGPRNRGRIYIPFPTEGLNGSPSEPNGTALIAMVSLAAEIFPGHAILGASGACTIAPVIFHRDSLGYTFLDQAIPRDKWATQRRRGSFGRPNVAPF